MALALELMPFQDKSDRTRSKYAIACHPTQTTNRTLSIMQLFQARLHGSPRTVDTKYGKKVVADAFDGKGNKHTIWRQEGDMKHLTNGSIVSLAIDSKGKVSLVDAPANLGAVAPTEPLSLPFEAETKLRQQMGFTADSKPSRSVEIADYIDSTLAIRG
jgi:hypothetical protein